MKKKSFLILIIVMLPISLYFMIQGDYVISFALVIGGTFITGAIEDYLKKNLKEENFQNVIYRVGDGSHRVLYSAIIVLLILNSFYFDMSINQVFIVLLSISIFSEIFFAFLYIKK